MIFILSPRSLIIFLCFAIFIYLTLSRQHDDDNNDDDDDDGGGGGGGGGRSNGAPGE